MLKALRISNIVLIERASLSFQEGFHAITGETGSGKSAITDALSYLVGAKSGTHLLRHGAEKGSIEASFDICRYPSIQKLLQDCGIDHTEGEELLIRRDLSHTGKTRGFINQSQVHLRFLRELGELLVEVVGQHASRKLTNTHSHRELLDLFGEYQPLLQEFRNKWERECALKKELHKLQTQEASRTRDLERFRAELQQIQEAKLKANEEDELFAEYSNLNDLEETVRHARAIDERLSDGRGSIISTLEQLQPSFSALCKTSPGFNHTQELFQSALIELQEIARCVRNACAKTEINEYRLIEINERLTLLSKIKKKYGPQMADVFRYQQEIEKTVVELETADIKIEGLEKELESVRIETEKLAGELSLDRKLAAKKLEEAMNQELLTLNMKNSLFSVSLKSEGRSLEGDESVEFFFTPNAGEKKISIGECASGGELCRLMLALKTILREKKQTVTLIFDEIDANIGGETATIIGEKLQKIAEMQQIICITHFPQVAAQAKHHTKISKEESEGRTYTKVTALKNKERKEELSRMMGERKK